MSDSLGSVSLASLVQGSFPPGAVGVEIPSLPQYPPDASVYEEDVPAKVPDCPECDELYEQILANLAQVQDLAQQLQNLYKDIARERLVLILANTFAIFDNRDKRYVDAYFQKLQDMADLINGKKDRYYALYQEFEQAEKDFYNSIEDYERCVEQNCEKPDPSNPPPGSTQAKASVQSTSQAAGRPEQSRWTNRLRRPEFRADQPAPRLRDSLRERADAARGPAGRHHRAARPQPRLANVPPGRASASAA